jgi:hypothetical protein
VTSSRWPKDPATRNREIKSAPFQDAQYKTLLTALGSFMDEYKLGISDQSKWFCHELLHNEQGVPQISLFRDDTFDAACRNIQDRNEDRVIQDISRLTVPSPETLAVFGDSHLKCLAESVNESWDSAVPYMNTVPQPDYSIGFNREAFTKDQHEKIAPFLAEFPNGIQSYFMGTRYQLFP